MNFQSLLKAHQRHRDLPSQATAPEHHQKRGNQRQRLPRWQQCIRDDLQRRSERGSRRLGGQHAQEHSNKRVLALLFIVIDGLPFEEHWRAWLDDEEARRNGVRVEVLVHAKYPEAVSSEWLRERLIDITWRPEWGSIELTRAGISLLEAALRPSKLTPSSAAATDGHTAAPASALASAAKGESESESDVRDKHDASQIRTQGVDSSGCGEVHADTEQLRPCAVTAPSTTGPATAPTPESASATLQPAAEITASPLPSGEATRLCFVSESCLPVVPLLEAASALWAQDPVSRARSWLDVRHEAENGYAQQGQWGKASLAIPPHLVCKADQWIMLTRAHACAVLELCDVFDARARAARGSGGGKGKGGKGRGLNRGDQHPELWQLFKRMSASDEMFFPTVLGLLGVLYKGGGNSGAAGDSRGASAASSSAHGATGSGKNAHADAPTAADSGDSDIVGSGQSQDEKECKNHNMIKGRPDGVLRRKVTWNFWSTPRSPDTYDAWLPAAQKAVDARAIFARKFKSGAVPLQVWQDWIQQRRDKFVATASCGSERAGDDGAGEHGDEDECSTEYASSSDGDGDGNRSAHAPVAVGERSSRKRERSRSRSRSGSRSRRRSRSSRSRSGSPGHGSKDGHASQRRCTVLHQQDQSSAHAHAHSHIRDPVSGDAGTGGRHVGSGHDQGQGYNYGRGHSQGQAYNYGQGQGYNYGQGQGYNYGHGQGQGYNYGRGQGYNYGQGQSYNYGQGQGYNYGRGQGPGQGYNYGQGQGHNYNYGTRQGQGKGQNYNHNHGQAYNYNNGRR